MSNDAHIGWHTNVGALKGDLTDPDWDYAPSLDPSPPRGLAFEGLAFDTTGQLVAANPCYRPARYRPQDAAFVPMDPQTPGATDVVTDSAGDLYAGISWDCDLPDNCIDAQHDNRVPNGHIYKLESQGIPTTFVTEVGVSYMDLAADQCTMYYTTPEMWYTTPTFPNWVDDYQVHRYDVCHGKDLAPVPFHFPTVTVGTTGHQYPVEQDGVRLLSDGSLLVATTGAPASQPPSIYRLDPTGTTVIKKYTFPDVTVGYTALALDADGQSFWASAQKSGCWQHPGGCANNTHAFDSTDWAILKVDLRSGNLVSSFPTPEDATPTWYQPVNPTVVGMFAASPFNRGLAVNGGPTAATKFRAATTTTLSASPSLATRGDPVTFTARVAPFVPGTALPTGTVTFSELLGGPLNHAPALLDGQGTASLTTSGLSPGTHQIIATYNGDNSYLTSVSLPVTVTVKQPGPPTPPTVDSVSPACVPTTGAPVVIGGKNLASPVGVTIGGRAVAGALDAIGAGISVSAPPHSPGPVPIRVTTGGLTLTVPVALTYSDSCVPPKKTGGFAAPYAAAPSQLTSQGPLTPSPPGGGLTTAPAPASLPAPAGSAAQAPVSASAGSASQAPVSAPVVHPAAMGHQGIVVQPDREPEPQAAAQENYSMVRHRRSPGLGVMETGAAGGAGVLAGCCFALAVRQRRHHRVRAAPRWAR